MVREFSLTLTNHPPPLRSQRRPGDGFLSAFLTLSLLTLSILSLSACSSPVEPSEREQAEKQLREMKALLQQTVEEVLTVSGAKLEELKGAYDPQDPLKELKKLRQFEYKVAPLALDPPKLEAELIALGREGWDCFHVEHSPSENKSANKTLLVFCKRRVETPLSYIPANVIGR
jgi:hypothetical protein